MSDKIQKFLAKLTPKERQSILQIMTSIHANKLSGINVQPLKGHKGYFRTRTGRVRIIFRLNGNSYEIIQVSNRDDQTYRDF